jgi:hypothetical protein
MRAREEKEMEREREREMGARIVDATRIEGMGGRRE